MKRQHWKFGGNEGSLEDDFKLLPNEFNYVTIIRDPISLTKSFYFFESGGKNFEASCGGWKKHYENSWARNNFMTRRLCGFSCVRKERMGESDYLIALEKLKQFDIVLVTDRLAEGQCVLHSVNEKLFKKGVRKSNNSDKKRFDWESCTEMKERILRNYEFDRRLYEFAKAKFDEKIQFMPHCIQK